MTVLKVLTFPHPQLRQAMPNLAFDASTPILIIDPLIDAMYRLGIWGLAAPEVGLKARIFVMDVSENRDSPRCFINPEIIERKGTILSEEDSLSLPGVGITASRSKQITLSFLDKHGQHQTCVLDHIESICAQQKIDQLNGIQLIDHLSKLKRERLLKKIEKEGLTHGHGHCGHGCDHNH